MFRFKQVLRIESSQATRPGVDLVYDDTQVWVKTKHPCQSSKWAVFQIYR